MVVSVMRRANSTVMPYNVPMTDNFAHQLDQAAAKLREASWITCLTGAGVSAESGVPTFRGQGGFWREQRAEDLATPEAFARDPLKVANFYRWRKRLLRSVEPNPGHYALAELEARAKRFSLITQNIDGLHWLAGSKEIIEIHGGLWTWRCTDCGHEIDTHDMPESEVEVDTIEELDHCPKCNGLMRPGVVWFGEMLPPEDLLRAEEAFRGCDLMLVVGTSALVQPAASFAVWAKQAGAYLIEANLEPTPLTDIADISLQGKSGELLPELVKRI